MFTRKNSFVQNWKERRRVFVFFSCVCGLSYLLCVCCTNNRRKAPHVLDRVVAFGCIRTALRPSAPHRDMWGGGMETRARLKRGYGAFCDCIRPPFEGRTDCCVADKGGLAAEGPWGAR